MNKIYYFIVSILFACTLVHQTTNVDAAHRLPRCHQIAFENCLKANFFSFGRLQNVSQFATSPEGFVQICRTFNESLDCIRTHLTKCGSPVHREIFDLATGEMQYEFYNFMCRPNSNQKAFFQHAACIREHVFAVDGAIPCLNNYLLAFEHIEQWTKTRSPEQLEQRLKSQRPQQQPQQQQQQQQQYRSYTLSDWVETICCAHQTKRRCTDRLAHRHCGAEAARAFDRFFEQIHFGFFTMICRDESYTMYDPDSERCRRAFPFAPDAKPKGLRSSSAISRLLVSYFPFNYVTHDARQEIHRIYLRAKSANMSDV